MKSASATAAIANDTTTGASPQPYSFPAHDRASSSGVAATTSSSPPRQSIDADWACTWCGMKRSATGSAISASGTLM